MDSALDGSTFPVYHVYDTFNHDIIHRNTFHSNSSVATLSALYFHFRFVITKVLYSNCNKSSNHEGTEMASFYFLLLTAILFSYASSVEVPFNDTQHINEDCPMTGPGSIAPVNFEVVNIDIRNAVLRIIQRQPKAIIISATANREASKWNLPVLFDSLLRVEPAFLNNTIIFSSDRSAQHRCANLHIDPSLCIYTDLRVSSESLVPGSNTQSTDNYWRIAYARMYGTMKIHEEGISVLQVDIDTVFLKNPFASPEELFEHPESMAGVVDTSPFSMTAIDEHVSMNAGFLFFPAATHKSAIVTNTALRAIWSKSCKYRIKSEQARTTDIMKEMARTMPINDTLTPRLLSSEKYLNFCSTDCGTPKFSEIQSIHDLRILEKEMEGKSTFRMCTKEIRRNWVFFHSACIAWPDSKGAGLSKAKGRVQEAIIGWAEESRM